MWPWCLQARQFVLNAVRMTLELTLTRATPLVTIQLRINLTMNKVIHRVGGCHSAEMMQFTALLVTILIKGFTAVVALCNWTRVFARSVSLAVI